MPHGVDLNLLGAVTTINTPRYHQIDIPTLVDCLMGRNGDPKWSAHIFSFFDEVDVSVLHKAVIDGVLTFEDLLRALEAWNAEGAGHAGWIREMGSFAMGGPAGESPRGT
jgi:hypothetical protein